MTFAGFAFVFLLLLLLLLYLPRQQLTEFRMT